MGLTHSKRAYQGPESVGTHVFQTTPK
jgi:hypothetical protein